MLNQEIAKFICHCCKKLISSELIIPCKTKLCKLFFCHKCLTSRYKYSKVKVSKLPTPNWKCPVCANRCRCKDCAQLGVVMPTKKPYSPILVKKKLIKPIDVLNCPYKRKRIRKDKDVFLIRLNCGAITPPSRNETNCNEALSQVVPRIMPPISGINSMITM